MWMSDADTLKAIIGRTAISATGWEKGSEIAALKFGDGAMFQMVHHQDCCESVSIEDVAGDPDTLVGSPITMAEEVSGEPPARGPDGYEAESETWTFVKFATAKGYVTVRWYGSSNGYYGEQPSYDLVEATQ